MHTRTEPEESQLLWVRGELNPISAPGFPSRDEMPALPQLDHCPAQGKATPPCASLCAFLLQQTFSGRNNCMSVIYHCPLDIWWLMQQISKYSHNAVVFQELLAMETQGHLRGDEWEG